jgi:hypothetical protein
LSIGWFVHGSLSTGFFSSGFGIGGVGSGFSAGGCTVDGASGIFCAGWVCCACPLGVWFGEVCPSIARTPAHRYAKTRAAASQFVRLHRFWFLLSAAVSIFTNTVRSFYDLFLSSSHGPSASLPIRHHKKYSSFFFGCLNLPFGASNFFGCLNLPFGASNSKG